MAEEGLPGNDAPKAAAVGPVGHQLIPIMNRLQDIFAHLGSSFSINLPQVAVVGSQSSGKSSVLEALVGRDFLPRGTDICTRRPLVLQLVRLESSSESAYEGSEEWGEFLHLPGKRFYDFSDIRREIQAETEREAGMRKAISDKQIRLKIFSPNVLNITLVDLPGITKVPVGDQPSDIEARIRTMIMSYIKHETCIILAVSPANADLANSDALQIARNADPDGSRTIGVITKLDIMDRGTDARNFLLGNVIPLRLGYVGVINRSQEDINVNRSIRDALVSEEAFFRKHPAYHGLSHCCGIRQLAKKLNRILEQHIMAVLPTLKSHINAQLVAVAKEHATYGESVESKDGQGVKILNILAKFCEGKHREQEEEEGWMRRALQAERKRKPNVTVAADGSGQVRRRLAAALRDCRELLDSATDRLNASIALIRTWLSATRKFRRDEETEGASAQLLCASSEPPRSFSELLRRGDGEEERDREWRRIMSHCCLTSELHHYPVLRKHMDEEITRFLREGLQPAETMISHIIGMEMDYINTSHPNFIGGSKAVESAQQQVKSSRLVPSLPKLKDIADSNKFQGVEKVSKSRGIFTRSISNGAVSDHLQGIRPVADSERPGSSGSMSGSIWGISSIFGASEDRTPAKESVINNSYDAPLQTWDHSFSMIQLREPPLTLKPSENPTEQEALEIAITKLLLKSYFDIVRKNVEDSVPKAIMHFLVNHTKRELHNVLIRKLYRENMFDEMLKEPDGIAAERKRLREKLKVLQQASKVLEELPFEAETAKGYTADHDPTDLPKARGIPSFYATNMDLGSWHTASQNPGF
ncbi:dynamin-related protein 3B-like [Curcuma longa]|uniref:dynamin-related protein 3B-like n=1 Tax=Curcuma longa TaxID=136217 RepID=UPI003D9F1E68